MAFWPALLLARSERLPWGLRGVLAGGAVLLAEVALLSQSRGSLYATPVMLVLVFALLPGRTRTFAVLVPVAAGIGAAAPAVLRVGDHLEQRRRRRRGAAPRDRGDVRGGAGGGARGRAGRGDREPARVLASIGCDAMRRGVGALAIATLVAVIGGGLAVAGNPVARVEHGWDSFKGGYAADSASGSRLTSGLGSNRYDFYRVALDEFAAHPLVGIGADNFQQQYLVHGRSDETPHYPHSVELRTLVADRAGRARCWRSSASAPRCVGRARARCAAPDPLARASRGGGARRVRLLAGARLGRLVLGVRRPGRAGLRAARARLRARARAPPRHPRRAERSRRTRRTDPPVASVGSRSRARPVAVRAVAAAVLALAAVVSLAAPWLSQLRGAERGRIWTTRAADGLRAAGRCRAAEPAERRGLPRGGQHRAALRRTGARRPRVRARARAHPRRRLRDARAGRDRLDARATRARRWCCSSGPCG